MAINTMNDVVFEKVVSAIGYHTSTGIPLWEARQLEEATLKITSDSNDVVDATGATIAKFYKALSGELTATNALFNLNIAAYQGGGTDGLIRATSTNKINTPLSEEFTISGASIVLGEIPTGTAGAEIPYIQTLDTQGYGIKNYSISSTASATTFALDAATKTITLPTGLATGTRVRVGYNADLADAVKMSVNADNTPLACRTELIIKCHDVCNPSGIVYGVLVLPNSQLAPDYELSFKSDGKHNLTITALKDYCSVDKCLYRFYLHA